MSGVSKILRLKELLAILISSRPRYVINKLFPGNRNVKSFPQMILPLLFAIFTLDAHSQSPDTTQDRGSQLIPWRVALVAGGTAGIITAAHLQNYDSWWKGVRGPFHLSVDDSYPLAADKCGHFLFSNDAADIVGRSFAWSGIERSRAMLYGAGAAFAFQLYVEIEDGFHPDLGFSFGDILADGLGSCYPMLQEKCSVLQAISPKWSAERSTRYDQGAYRTIFDDYESQNYWLSVNIDGILGESAPRYIPSWLNIAVGYGVTNLDLHGNGDREFYLGFDIDCNKLPGDGDFLKSVKHLLNYLHVPAPTIRLSPTLIGYGLRF